LDAVLGKIAGLSTGEVHVFKGETQYRLDMVTVLNRGTTTEENFLVRSWVDAQTFELTSIEYRSSDDDVVVSVECEDYREVNLPAVSGQGPIRLPFVVKATDHRSSGGSITLNFQEFILNAV
ncbi:MAG: hypothetical protein OEZ05_16735, partial [Nitrospirota bacterium]|nr:hypothetical protein [Nitrospirota bacterium]